MPLDKNKHTLRNWPISVQINYYTYNIAIKSITP